MLRVNKKLIIISLTIVAFIIFSFLLIYIFSDLKVATVIFLFLLSFATLIANFLYQIKIDLQLSHLKKLILSKHNSMAYNIKNQSIVSFQQSTYLKNLEQSLPKSFILPPMRGWAISPDAALLIYNQMKKSSVKSILELGSGATTLLTNLYSKDSGAKVCTIDHDKYFIEETIKYLKLNNLYTYNINHADLKEYTDNDKKTLWYTDTIIKQNTYDFVIIDGPPEIYDFSIRANAMKHIYPLLEPGCLIVLDDYNRNKENKAVFEWLKNYDLEIYYQSKYYEKGIVILQKLT